MTIRYKVRATVIDLVSDLPQPTDRFLVDTNVWYWLTYPPASSSAKPYQINCYPNYIQAAIVANAQLYCAGLSFAELAHLIERSCQKIFAPAITAKEYRHNHPGERARVVTEVQTAWALICSSYASQIDCSVDRPTVAAACQRFQTQMLDGYDLLILESMRQQGLTQVITDDGDYVTVPGLQVFTANQTVIQAARRQGKLIARN